MTPAQWNGLSTADKVESLRAVFASFIELYANTHLVDCNVKVSVGGPKKRKPRGAKRKVKP